MYTMPIPRLDLINQRFGRLLVIEFVGLNKHSQSIWKCRCDCGNEKTASVTALNGERTRSCGCLRTGRQGKRARLLPLPGKFRCTKCKTQRPLSEKIPDTNYRCIECGPGRAPKHHPELRMWRSAKKRADACSVPFTIRVEDIVIPEICPVLGVPLVHGIRGNNQHAPSLDRIIPEKGYVPGNVAVISFRANTLKRDGTLQEFQKLVQWLMEAGNGNSGANRVGIIQKL